MPLEFIPFQSDDYAAMAMTNGAILAHDTGLGKSLAAYTIPLIWLDFERAWPVKVKGAVLIVAPGDLHPQLCAEWKKFYGIEATIIEDQAHLFKLVGGKRALPNGFYLTSYSKLTINKVKRIHDLFKLPTEEQINALSLKPKHVQAFYDDRGKLFARSYSLLDVATQTPPEGIRRAALAAKREAQSSDMTREQIDKAVTLIHMAEVELLPFSKPFTPKVWEDCDEDGKTIWRMFAQYHLTACCDSIGAERNKIKCVYSPSMADLISTLGAGSCLFDCAVYDEGVRMKSTHSKAGIALRQLTPRFRLVLTGTPVKNRLPDLFWLMWWTAGGHPEPTARFPYEGTEEAQRTFAETFMVTECNLTKAAASKTGKSRFTKLRPDICNVHLLWKLNAPNILRRRKQDCGLQLVEKIRHVYRVPMGAYQNSVYKYHFHSTYLDCNLKPAPGPKLQALRIAASAPDSELLTARPPGPGRDCCDAAVSDDHGFCGNCGSIIPRHVSPYIFTPKVALQLKLITDIIAAGEQVAVFSAFNDPSDNLARYLTEASIPHFVLDGRVNQKRRGHLSTAFNRGDFPVTLAGLGSMSEGHNWNRVQHIILSSYTWEADKMVQAINRVHRMTSKLDVHIHAIICSRSADRVLEENIGQKTDASELAIDGALLDEMEEERSIEALLASAAKDFTEITKEENPDERRLEKTWPEIRMQLRAAMAKRGKPVITLDIPKALPAISTIVPKPTQAARVEPQTHVVAFDFDSVHILPTPEPTAPAPTPAAEAPRPAAVTASPDQTITITPPKRLLPAWKRMQRAAA